jgi:chitinase
VLDQAEQNRYNALVNDPLVKDPPATDTDPPSAPTALIATAGSVNGSPRVTLTWGPATDDVGVSGHIISRNGQQIATSGTATSFVDTAVAANSTYTYTVAARDAAGNVSPPSDPATVTTPVVTGPDTTPPTPPGSPTAVAGAVGSRQITFSWTASIDNIGVASYRVFRNNAQYRTVSGATTSFSDTGLTAGTTYTYKVYAVDAAGNWSGSSGTARATAR